MYKKGIAISFIIIFMSLITAPSIIAALDDSIDTSVFYSLSEEEEHSKSKIAPLYLQINEYNTSYNLKDLQGFGYQFKNYAKPHLNLISPPPDQNIL